jgi:hypothetical protein
MKETMLTLRQQMRAFNFGSAAGESWREQVGGRRLRGQKVEVEREKIERAWRYT